LSNKSAAFFALKADAVSRKRLDLEELTIYWDDILSVTGLRLE